MINAMRIKNLDGVKNARLFRVEQDIETAEKCLLEYQNAADIAELAARAVKRDAGDLEHLARKEKLGLSEQEKNEIDLQTKAALEDLDKTYDMQMELSCLIRKNENAHGLPLSCSQGEIAMRTIVAFFKALIEYEVKAAKSRSLMKRRRRRARPHDYRSVRRREARA